MDVILTTMDQREERIMMAMEQREEKVKELEQTLNNISKYIKSLQDQSPNNSSSSIQQPVHIEFPEQTVYRRPQHHQHRTVKVDFPRFDGQDVLPWIYKAEQYFEYYRVEDMERL